MSVVLAVLLLGAVPADDVRWPALPEPAPVKPQAPTAVSVLKADELFIVESDAPCNIIASPSDRAKVTVEAGPLRVRGKFSDGNGKVESRTYKGKQVFIVERTGDGDVELILVKGAAPDYEFQRRVLAGEGPRPPPIPVEPVQPQPKAERWIKPDGLHVLVVYPKNKALSADQGAVLFGAEARKTLEDSCVAKSDGLKAYRIWYDDVDASQAPEEWQALFARKRSSSPWIVLTNGDKQYEGPLPADVAAFNALVSKYK